ncbi:MAG: 2-deoxy-D-gluconate 3-dehydrogenase [Deltaproteobacteria bacterium RBG_16_48_10]|nr:MAG: 2-deoxy-D-gluconate 3-dehydrogenase [Deltaproteobacteria bacterium RBG_16_48_10]
MEFPSQDVRGKVAIVLGASRNIGRTLALGLAHAGADVVVASRSVADLESLAADIRAMGQRALVQSVDVTKAGDIQAMVDASVATFGRIDILVNNAGTNINKAALDMTEEDWDLVLDTNLKSYFLASQAAGRFMVKQRKGKIINVSSTFGLVGFEKRSAYASSKGGVGQLTKVLAIEWGPYNVNVNAIAPTATRTTLNEELFANEAWQKWMLDRLPVKRFCQPVDLVGATVFLASDASDMVTGVTLPVDGGWTAW